MYRLTLALADNVRGSTPLANLYRVIARQHPTLGLTQANTRVALLIEHSDRENPLRAYMQLTRVSNPNSIYEFQFDRFDIKDMLTNPLFGAAELPAIKAIKTSAELLAAIAAKTNLNLTPADFWVDSSGIEYAGGSIRPNWTLKSRFDSIFWCGVFNLHLN